jgi:hypothetical protein
MQMYTENRIAALHPGMNRQIGYTAKEAIYADKILGPVRFADGSVGNAWDNWAARIPFNDARLRDATVAWTSNQVTAMKQQVQEVLRWETVLDKFVNVLNIGPGLEAYEWAADTDLPAPRETDTFEGQREVRTLTTTTTLELLGFDYDHHFNMPEIDRMSNPNAIARYSENNFNRNLRNMTKSLTQYREWSLFRGTDIPNMPDSGLNGLVNDAGLTDPGAVGNADSLVGTPYTYVAATDLAQFLIGKKFKPPFVLLGTPGVIMQAIKNKNATTSRSDYSFIVEGDAGMKLFSDFILCPYLIDSETETNATAAMCALAVNKDNFEIVETYPLGYYPLPPVGLGVQGKLLWQGRAAIYRPTSIAFADALTVNTL